MSQLNISWWDDSQHTWLSPQALFIEKKKDEKARGKLASQAEREDIKLLFSKETLVQPDMMFPGFPEEKNKIETYKKKMRKGRRGTEWD